MSSEVAELERAVGELPDGWTSRRLLDICRPRQWPTISREQFTDEGYPVYGANGQIGLYSEFTHGSETIAITCRGATCGTINLVPARSYITGNAMALDDLDGSIVAQSYLYQALQHWGVANSISGSAQPQITRQSLSHVAFPFPPLDEQRRIAEVLRSVDEAIAAKEAALVASKLFKRTCREAAVARFKHNAPVRLQSVLATIDAGWSPDCESEPANEGEWSILKTSAVVWKGYVDEENKRLPSHLEPRPHLEVVPDDILITRAGPAERTGVIAIVRHTAGRRMLSDKIIRLRMDRKKAVPLAIAELLSSDHVQGELIRSKSGMAASQTNISQKIVLGLEMHLPPLSEQRDFADEMAAHQDAIEASEVDLQTALDLKTAIMSDLLSGRVRVPA